MCSFKTQFDFNLNDRHVSLLLKLVLSFCVLFHSAPFHSFCVLFCSFPFCPIQFHYVLFCSVLSCPVFSCSVLSCHSLQCSVVRAIVKLLEFKYTINGMVCYAMLCYGLSVSNYICGKQQLTHLHSLQPMKSLVRNYLYILSMFAG